jgi:hypothetical protein
MIDPPYLYGYLPGERSASAAFWCYRHGDSTYLLVTTFRGRLASQLAWHNVPGGLSLAADAQMRLAEFRHVGDSTRFGPANLTTEYQPLQSEYDGVVTLFYEHEGQWLYRILH